MVWVSADVEIDLEDVDEDDLIEELEARGYKCVEDTSTAPTDLERELITAFKLKKLDRVLELVRKDLEDRKGIIL